MSSRFQDWLRLRKSRSVPVRIPSRARFPIDDALVSKQLGEAERLKSAGVRVKALR